VCVSERRGLPVEHALGPNSRAQARRSWFANRRSESYVQLKPMSQVDHRRLKLSIAALLYVGAVAFALARVFLLSSAGHVRLNARWVMLDFYSNQYYPVRALLDGVDPHNSTRLMALYPVSHGYLPYTPMNLVLHLPFGLLPPVPAGIAYFIFTALLTIVLAHFALRLAGVRADSGRALLVAAAILLSRPGQWALLLGQVAILLTLATYSILLDNSWSPLRNGLGLLVTLIKVTFGVPLAILLWADRRRRDVVVGIALAALVNLPLFMLFVGWEGGLEPFIRAVRVGFLTWEDRADTSFTRVDVTSLISRFLGSPLPAAVQALLSIVLLSGAAAVIFLLAKHRTRAAGDLAVGIICTATCFVGYHLEYDLVLLIAPFLAVAAKGVPGTSSRVLRWAALGLFTIPAMNWAASGAVMAAWRPPHALWLLVSSADGFSLAVLFAGYLWLGLRYHLPASTTSALSTQE
jgi:hypothetical protein